MARTIEAWSVQREALFATLLFCLAILLYTRPGHAADWQKCPLPLLPYQDQVEPPQKATDGPTAVYIDASGSMDGFVQRAGSPYTRLITNLHRVLPRDTAVFKFSTNIRRLDQGPAAIADAAQPTFYRDSSINDSSYITLAVDAAVNAEATALTLIVTDLFLSGNENRPRSGPMRSALVQALKGGKTIGILGVLNPVVLHRGFDPKDLGRPREQHPPGIMPSKEGSKPPSFYLPVYVVAIGPEARVQDILRQVKSVADLTQGETIREAIFSGRQAPLIAQSGRVSVQANDARALKDVAAPDLRPYKIEQHRIGHVDKVTATLTLDKPLDQRVSGTTGLTEAVTIRLFDEQVCRRQRSARKPDNSRASAAPAAADSSRPSDDPVWRELKSGDLRSAFRATGAEGSTVQLSINPAFFQRFRPGDAILIDVSVAKDITRDRGTTDAADAWMSNIPAGWGFDDSSWGQIQARFAQRREYGPEAFFPTLHLQELRDSLHEVVSSMDQSGAQTIAYGRMLFIID